MNKISQIISAKILQNQDLINDFFFTKFSQNQPIFYNSVDLRHSQFKIAPIDNNCFPAGFNNIKNDSKQNAKLNAQNHIKKYYNNAQKILIIPENHSRNLKYLENILSLQQILQNSNNQVIIGSLIEDIEDISIIEVNENSKIQLEKIIRIDNKIITKTGFEPDLIILNNDLTSQNPEILKNIQQPITPSTKLGWYKRSKAKHFSIYNNLANEICELINLDPWLISSYQSSCDNVDFKNNVGFECLSNEVDILLNKIKKKYQEYNIKSEPYCYIKADSGTYGMAITQVFSAQEALSFNKKERNKMNMLKESKKNNVAFIQEGIPTADIILNNNAEPLIYLIDGEIIANLFRANKNRNDKNSLNAMGAEFFDLKNLTPHEINIGDEAKTMILIYEFIAKLSALSAAIELKNDNK